MNSSIHKKIYSALAILIAVVISINAAAGAVPLVHAAEDIIEEYSFHLNSNSTENKELSVYDCEGIYYITIDDLCSLTRCSFTVEEDTVVIKQGVWKADFDYGRQMFEDGWQSVDMRILDNGTHYLVPALEFLTYFGANAYIDSNVLYCIMPACTAWEALALDYESSLVDIYKLYGGEDEVKFSLTLDILMDFLLGGAGSGEQYIKDAYDNALAVNLYEFGSIKEYVNSKNSEYYQYLTSDEGEEAADFAFGFLDHSISGLEYLTENYYNTLNVNLADLVLSSNRQGLLDESTHYAEEILNGYRKKNSVSDLATAGASFLQVSLVLVQSALESAQELKYVSSTNNIVYHVMGEENTSVLGMDVSENEWFTVANTYKNEETITSSNLLDNAASNFANLGWDQLIGDCVHAFTGTSALLWNFSKDCAVSFAKLYPPTRSSIEAFKAERLALYLSELQRNVLYVISSIDFKGDYANEELFRKLIEAELLYCRVSIAMYRNMITVVSEFGNNKQQWTELFQKQIDELAVSMYRLTLFQEDSISSCLPLDLSAFSVPAAEEATSLREEELLSAMQTKAGRQMETYVYVDMDHDGAGELIGTYCDETGMYQTWYCSSDGEVCSLVHQNNDGMDACEIRLLDLGDETHVVLNAYRMMGTGKNYSILSLQDKSISCLISNSYGYVSMTTEGDIALDVEGYDAMYDPDIGSTIGHTWKDTYLYFDGAGYREYGATELSEEEFLGYEGALQYKETAAQNMTQYESDIADIKWAYFKRKNGILHIECDVYSVLGGIQYGYYTIRYKDGKLYGDLGEYISGQMAPSFSDLEVTY